MTSLLHDSDGIISASVAATQLRFIYERDSSRSCRSNVLCDGSWWNEKGCQSGTRELSPACFDGAFDVGFESVWIVFYFFAAFFVGPHLNSASPCYSMSVSL